MARQTKKNIFIQNYIYSKGNISDACKETGISRQTFYRWKAEKLFSETLEAANDSILDIVESNLLQLTHEKHFPAIKFYLESKGEKRGYGNKSGVSITTTGNEIQPIQVVLNIKKPHEIPDAFNEADFED